MSRLLALWAGLFAIAAPATAAAAVLTATITAANISHTTLAVFQTMDQLVPDNGTLYVVGHANTDAFASVNLFTDEGRGGESYFGPGTNDPFDHFTAQVGVFSCNLSNCFSVSGGGATFSAMIKGPTVVTPEQCFDGTPVDRFCLLSSGTHLYELDIDVGNSPPGWEATFTFSDQPLSTPEPSTWALMIVGFGATGALLRRRQAFQA